MDFYNFNVGFVIFLVCLWSAIFSPARSDMFTAVDKLKGLLHYETDLLRGLKSYMTKEAEADNPVAEDLKEKFHKLQAMNKADKSKNNLVENPLNSYHLIARIRKTWQGILDEVICPECEEWQTRSSQELVRAFEAGRSSWPSDSDMEGIASALFRLVEVYTLNMQELLAGKIYDTQAEPLTNDDVLYISNIAVESDGDKLYEAARWLRAGLKRVRNTTKEDQTEEIKFSRALAGVYYKANMTWIAESMMDRCQRKFPGHKGVLRDLVYYQSRARRIPEEERNRKLKRKYRGDQPKILVDYEALCSGRKGTPKRGMCRYKDTKIPIYRAKEDILSVDPRIVMYHDVIIESEMKLIKTLAFDKLFRSQVVGTESSNAQSGIRVSQSAWLDNTNAQIRRISKRIELISGMSLEIRLRTSDAEQLQVLNYGIGGMYEPHWDFFNCSTGVLPDEPISLQNSGDRIATFLFYLNDVKVGGATVFPFINVRVPVVKGSAAFWYNLKRTGDGDDRTLHAGCPVLLGSKWVCNKWIRLNGQMFNRRCGLTEEATDDWP